MVCGCSAVDGELFNLLTTRMMLWTSMVQDDVTGE